MKSGPTLNGATTWPAWRSAPIKPVATVVFPLPEAGAATTTAGVLTTSPSAASVHRMPLYTACRCTNTHARGRRGVGSPLDAFLAFAPDVHRVLDLGHLGDQIGGVRQSRRGITSGDHHMLAARARQQGIHHVIDVDPSPLQRIGEFVEYVEVVLLLGQSLLDLGPAIGGRG